MKSHSPFCRSEFLSEQAGSLAETFKNIVQGILLARGRW
ncbi:hypothetical protein BRCON_0975 [Candidatus Sumerlaea chitinivorans]|uniref:Uncharacterized protein n=1 Tax=Sumerlaea chitinivorans TaxID=2250252 RepID=A0A2Z4Y4U7_SUMC1|nr:hypothetical protein BRCON_0975 [Candidatus Sumerlaea chitinivorans]